LNSSNNIVVARAAAEIAFHAVTDVIFRWFRNLVQQINRAHHHTGRAKAALQAVMDVKGFLHRVHFVTLGEPLNRRHVSAIGLRHEHGAALHRFAIDMHGAATTLCGVAADMRAGEALMVTDKFNQQSARFDLSRNGLPVDRHVHIDEHDKPRF
jgi:hypothetical protein